MSFKYEGPGIYICDGLGDSGEGSDRIYVTDVSGNIIRFHRGTQDVRHMGNISAFDGYVKQEEKQRAFSEEQVLGFASYLVEGSPEELRIALEEWIDNEKQKNDAEYREYLRLKEKFGG